jgi:HAD superfamily hydrolase (TIGR01549 family)
VPKNIQLIIFDLDGTLVDAYKAVASSLNFSLTSCGFAAVDDEMIKRSVGWGDKNLIGRFVPAQDVDKVLSIYRIHHARALKSGTKFLPGVRDILLFLKENGYKLSIASNRPTRFTEIILKHLEARDLFDVVLCADKVAHPKPAPDIIYTTLKRLKLAQDQVLYVGDMAIDMETGAGAGVKTAGVLTGSSIREEIEAHKPYAVIENISQLKNVLIKLG